MANLEARGQLSLPGLFEDVPIAAMDVVWSGGQPQLWVATESGGGIGQFALSDTGLAAARTHWAYDTTRSGLSGVDLLMFDTGETASVVPLGPSVVQWTAYQVGPDGHSSTPLTGGREAARARAAVAAQLDGQQSVVALSDTGAALTLYRVAPDGGLTLVRHHADLGGSFSALTVTDSGVVLATDGTTQAIVSFTLTSVGGLTRQDSLGAADGLGLSRPTAVEAVTIEGQDYVVVAAAGSATLSVLQVGSSGALTPVDHVADSGLTRFEDVTHLSTARWQDWVFVVAAGSDLGVSVFALLPDGHLLHLDSHADTVETSLAGISALTAAVINDHLLLFSSASREAGVSQLHVDLSDLGEIRISGDGGAQDDVLIAAKGTDQLRGGAGADTFVFRASAATAEGKLGHVLDFDPTQDRLDLSALPFLYDVSQLEITPTGQGATLRFGSHWVEVVSASGTSLSAEVFSNEMLLNAQHLPLGGVTVSGGGSDPDPGAELLGTAGADVLVGGMGADRLSGFTGDDTLNGGVGADHLLGHAGQDRLLGGADEDVLDGGTGADTLNGGDGDDVLIGGPDEDDLRDVIYGGAGDDNMRGGAGNDLLFGMEGNDTLSGGFGADELQGQEGNDVITGSAFSDLVFGGAGDDFVNGGFGFDRINGGSGADKFFHVGVEGHGSDWVQDYSALEGDVLVFGEASVTADDFQINYAHTTNPAGERSGADAVQEAFVIYKPTGQIIWALVDGAGQDAITLQLGAELFDLLV